MTSKERAQLIKEAAKMTPIFRFGKSGISPEFTKAVSEALEARELIKCRTLDNCEYSSKEAANLIAEAVGADVVSVVGSRFVLYKQSSKEKNRKIVL